MPRSSFPSPRIINSWPSVGWPAIQTVFSTYYRLFSRSSKMRPPSWDHPDQHRCLIYTWQGCKSHIYLWFSLYHMTSTVSYSPNLAYDLNKPLGDVGYRIFLSGAFRRGERANLSTGGPPRRVIDHSPVYLWSSCWQLPSSFSLFLFHLLKLKKVSFYPIPCPVVSPFLSQTVPRVIHQLDVPFLNCKHSPPVEIDPFFSSFFLLCSIQSDSVVTLTKGFLFSSLLKRRTITPAG